MCTSFDYQLSVLQENYRLCGASAYQTFREYVEREAINDAGFFRWFFGAELADDFDSSLTDEQRLLFAAFLDTLPGYYILDIYKLDVGAQLTEDAPYLTIPFEFKYSPADPEGDNDEIFALETQVRKLAHEKRPIDSAGYRVICRDLDGGEHLPIDVMY